MALVSAVALLGGHLLGGPTLGGRGSLAMASAVRHPGLAMMIAGANTTDKHATAAILGFLLVGLVVAIPYQLWIKRRAAMGGDAAEAPAA
jgi:BASS family bile acid:Na+ symporter